MGFAQATAGEARVLGLDCWKQQDAIRRRSGYVAGDVRLPGQLTVGQFLGILSKLRGEPARTALDLCAQLELDPTLSIQTLSKGNRQKVGLVAALAHRPPVLVLDEPTSGLDPLLQQRFLELIAEARSRDQAILLSSHQLNEVQRVCDRVAIIRDGMIVAEAPVEELRAEAPRRLVLYGEHPIVVPEGLGVQALAREGRRHEYLVKGPLPPVLAWLATIAPADAELAPPDLQDLFLTYYSSDKKGEVRT